MTEADHPNTPVSSDKAGNPGTPKSPRPSLDPQQNPNLAALQAHLDTYSSGNYEAIQGLLTDDVIHVTPFLAKGDLSPFLYVQGKLAVLGHIKLNRDRYAQIKLMDQVSTLAQDPNIIFLETVGHLILKKGSVHDHNRYIYKFVLRGGLIQHSYEYANLVPFAEVFYLPLG